MLMVKYGEKYWVEFFELPHSTPLGNITHENFWMLCKIMFLLENTSSKLNSLDIFLFMQASLCSIMVLFQTSSAPLLG